MVTQRFLSILSQSQHHNESRDMRSILIKTLMHPEYVLLANANVCVFIFVWSLYILTGACVFMFQGSSGDWPDGVSWEGAGVGCVGYCTPQRFSCWTPQVTIQIKPRNNKLLRIVVHTHFTLRKDKGSRHRVMNYTELRLWVRGTNKH